MGMDNCMADNVEIVFIFGHYRSTSFHCLTLLFNYLDHYWYIN